MSDFIAHLVKEEVTEEDKNIIDGSPFHRKNNENGITLKSLALLFKMKIVTTMGKQRSPLTIWRRKSSTFLTDYILVAVQHDATEITKTN